MKRFWRKKRKAPLGQMSPVETLDLVKSRQFRTQLKKHFSAVFVLCVGSIVCAGSLASLFLMGQFIGVSHAIRMRGVVQAIEVSTPISHTVGGVVKNVMITEGEVVQEGQVLMSLDAGDLKAAQIEARKSVARLLLRNLCLRALQKGEQDIQIPQVLKNTVGQLNQVTEMRRALADCKTRIEQRALDTAQTENTLAALRDQISMYRRLVATDRDLRLSRREAQGEPTLSALTKEAQLTSLLQALDYSILMSKTEQQLFIAKSEAESNSLTDEQKFRQELERNSDALMLAEAELSRLGALVDHRFIYATTSGRIQRLRITEAGKRISAGAYIMEIAPLTSDFEVISSVPLKDMEYLNLNQLVSVQFSGSSPIPLKVPGRIVKISKVSANARSVTIQISREDLNRRDLLLGDRLLSGQSEQAEAVVSIQAQTAGRALLGILRPAKDTKFDQDVDA